MISHPKAVGRLLFAVMAAGLMCRIGLVFGTGNVPEIFEYDELARNLLSGQGYVYTHLGTPYWSFYPGVFYIWLTAGLYAAFPPGYAAVLVAQSLFSILLAGVIFNIGSMMWNRRAGLVAAFLVLFHPAFVYYDTHKLHPLSLDALAMSTAVLALLWFRKAPSAGVALLVGLAQGVAILQRGSVILLLPFGLVWLWWSLRGQKRFFLRATAYLLGVFLVISPWVARNYSRHGVPLFATTAAEHFWRGNAPHSYGSSYLPSGQTVLETAPEAFLEELRSEDELGQARVFRQSALASARERPLRFASGVVRKWFYFWTFAPQTGLLYPPSYSYTYMAYYFLIAALSVLGAIRLARVGDSQPAALPALLMICVVFLSVSTIHSILYFELRHRWGIEPMLLILTSIGVLSAWERLRPAGSRPRSS